MPTAAPGILFNVKPNGDWLAVRYNDTENNVALWEFHNGIRRPLIRPRDGVLFTAPGDRATVARAEARRGRREHHRDARRRGASSYALGTPPRPGRNNAPPNPDLIPANNPVLRAAGRRQDRPVVEDRHHQLFQGLRGRHEVGSGFTRTCRGRAS